MRKYITAIMITLVMIVSAGAVYAADSFVFQGSSQKFVTDVSGTAGSGFDNMEPGETRDLSLTLTNADSNDTNFYMSAEILKNIAEQGDKNAIYDFSIAKNGTVFFDTVIGGSSSDKQNISIGSEYLQEDNTILLDTLSKGQKDTITISLKLDGDSAENAYMNQTGKIQLVFSAGSPVTPSPGNIVNTIVRYVTGQGTVTTVNANVNTGVQGTMMPIILVLVLLAAAIIIVFAVLKKKRRDRNE